MRCYETFSLGNDDAIITDDILESVDIMEEAFKVGKILYLKLLELTQREIAIEKIEEFDALENK